MRAILATLEQCRAALVKNTRPETAKLVALAILDLRIDLTHTSDAELKALSDVMALDETLAAGSRDPNSPDGPRRAVLKLVK
jgi:hypothetical protein